MKSTLTLTIAAAALALSACSAKTEEAAEATTEAAAADAAADRSGCLGSAPLDASFPRTIKRSAILSKCDPSVRCLWRLFLGAGSANAGFAACVFRNARQQGGLEFDLAAPAGRLFHAGSAFHLHGAFVGLAAQRALVGISGQGNLHGNLLGCEWLYRHSVGRVGKIPKKTASKDAVLIYYFGLRPLRSELSILLLFYQLS